MLMRPRVFFNVAKCHQYAKNSHAFGRPLYRFTLLSRLNR
jgi:hypothetical protein